MRRARRAHDGVCGFACAVVPRVIPGIAPTCCADAMTDALPPLPLPPGIRSRFVDNHRGLRVHVLEAGFEGVGRPAVLLLHGFPELAWSWRKVMGPLAAAGFHVIAPDQRGYGATSGWDRRYDGDLASFRILNLVRDTLGLVSALGLRAVASVVG